MQQRGCFLAGERQVTRADLGDPALGPQPGDPQRRLIPACQHQPGAVRDVIGQHRHRGPARPVVQQVHVVQDQRDRRGHRREGRTQPGDDRAGNRAPRGGQRVEYPPAHRLDGIERFGDVGEQDLRVVVLLAYRHPGERLAVTLGPLRQQRRLAVTGRRDCRHDRTGVLPRQLLDRRRPPDRPGPHQGTARLRHDQVEHRPATRV